MTSLNWLDWTLLVIIAGMVNVVIISIHAYIKEVRKNLKLQILIAAMAGGLAGAALMKLYEKYFGKKPD